EIDDHRHLRYACVRWGSDGRADLPRSRLWRSGGALLPLQGLALRKGQAMTPAQFHEVALSFPNTELSTAYGQPAYKAFGKFLTRLRKEDDSVVLGCVPLD